MTKKDDRELADLADMIGRCYKSDVGGCSTYMQISGIVMQGRTPAELPLEVTHIMWAPGSVIFRRSRLAPSDLRPEHIQQQEITPEEYTEEIRELLDSYAPLEIPDAQQKKDLIAALKKGGQ